MEIQSWFGQFSLDVILSCAFGLTSNVQTEPDSELIRQVQNSFKTSGLLRVSRILPWVEKVLRFVVPGNNIEFVIKLAREVVSNRRKLETSDRKDALHLMLMAHEGNTGEGVKKLSDEEVLANVIVFLIAGHETTSHTLSAILYYLILNPNIQEKLYLEITGTIQSQPDTPLYDLIHNIEYLDCVVKETQRILPVGEFEK